MWNRILRIFQSGVSFAALRQNPFKIILAAFFAALVPYLLYLLLGGLLFVLILVAGIFLLYKLIVSKKVYYKK